MKTFFDHIEHVKKKPHHIRKRIAFGVAGTGAALVALVWFIGSLSLGTFAIQGSSFASDSGQAPAVSTGDDSVSGLAGAAAALPSTSAPAQIEIVDTTSSTTANQIEQTTLPF